MQAIVLAAALLLACCSGSRDRLLQQAEDVARVGGLVGHRLDAGRFEVLGFERPGPEHGILVIYIEGDGRAWTNPWQPATDPTPTDPIGLRLAAADPARPLLYLARPCQFVVAAGCDARWWTGERLSAAVVEAFQQLIDDARWRTHSDRIGLVGYSGGGALAALIAERRHDVAWLITVAANLDLASWVRANDIDPLTGSLDPAAQAAALERVPQAHLVGADDRIVPPKVVESFLARLSSDAPARLIVVPGFDHGCCWAGAWPRLLAQLPGR